MKFFYSHNNLNFVQKLCKEYSASFSHVFKFFTGLRQPLTPSLNISPKFDFIRQGIFFLDPNSDKSIQGPNSNQRNRKDSLSKRMLFFNGVTEAEIQRNRLSEEERRAPFRLVDNHGGRFCNSYPTRFLVPSIISDTVLKKVCSFRSKERIPIMTYMHLAKIGTVNFLKC